MNVNATAVNKTARGSLLTRCKTPRSAPLERKSSPTNATCDDSKDIARDDRSVSVTVEISRVIARGTIDGALFVTNPPCFAEEDDVEENKKSFSTKSHNKRVLFI